jgi:hypothetical protein
MLIFTEAFMVGYANAMVAMLIIGFLATEVKFKRTAKDWVYE